MSTSELTVTAVMPKVFNPAEEAPFDFEMEIGEVDAIISDFHLCPTCRRIYNRFYCIFAKEIGMCKHPLNDPYPNCFECHFDGLYDSRKELSILQKTDPRIQYEFIRPVDWSDTGLDEQICEIATLLWLPLDKILHQTENEYNIDYCFQIVQLQINTYGIDIIYYRGRIWLMVHTILCLMIEIDMYDTIGRILATLHHKGEQILTIDPSHSDITLSYAITNPICVPITIQRV
jgi:hypothetical protein